MADSQRKTANLFDKDNIVDGGAYYPSIAGERMISSDNTAICLLPCKPNTAYTVSRSNAITKRFAMCFLTSNEIYNDMPIINGVNTNTGLIITSTSTSDSRYLCFYYAKTGGSDSNTSAEISSQLAEVMINEGSTPLPYEPYGWVHSLRKLGTATDTITTLPADLYADGNNATVGLVGNMSQTGTPTPATPIQPQECGERTGNLWNITPEQGGFSSTTGEPTESTDSNYTRRIRSASFIALNSGMYTISANYDVGVYVYDTNGSYQSSESYTTWNTTPFTFQIGANRKIKLIFRNIGSNTQLLINDFDNEVMLNEGSTPLPYEPYGYKIPILSADTTTNVYLGEVQTTRKIRKLVLTGEEDWNNNFGLSLFCVQGLLNDAPFVAEISAYSTHFIYNPVQSGLDSALSSGEFALQKTATPIYNVFLKNTAFTSTNGFKAWLAAQYANGTPVTVWYVLAEPTTVIVNEPLRKIGEYADTVSGITIPTITGKDTFDVQTTLKPSEVDLTYHGWHRTEPKERVNGSWV